MSYCLKCGTRIDQKRYCPKCGNINKNVLVDTKPTKQLLSQSSKPSKSVIQIKEKSKIPWVVGAVALGIVVLLIALSSPSEESNNQVTDANDNTGYVASSDELIRSTVVSIYCEDDEGISGGTGTLIANNGLVLTNSHVIPQDEESLLTPDYGCIVTLPNPDTGKPKEQYVAEPIVLGQLSENYDLAFLQIYDSVIGDSSKIQSNTTFPSLENNCENSSPKLGENIRIYGYPMTTQNNNLTVTEGVISNFDNNGRILTSAKIDHGNSGGLAVDSNNCMIGVPNAVTAVDGAEQNLGIIIPMNLILQFVDQIEIEE